MIIKYGTPTPAHTLSKDELPAWVKSVKEQDSKEESKESASTKDSEDEETDV